MNLHFIFFLLDIIVWLTIALLFCSQIYIEKSKRIKLSKTTIFSVFILSLCSGLFSALVIGIPDIGFSMNSFAFAFTACFGVIFYAQTKQNKLIPKYSKQK